MKEDYRLICICSNQVVSSVLKKKYYWNPTSMKELSDKINLLFN